MLTELLHNNYQTITEQYQNDNVGNEDEDDDGDNEE